MIKRRRAGRVVGNRVEGTAAGIKTQSAGKSRAQREEPRDTSTIRVEPIQRRNPADPFRAGPPWCKRCHCSGEAKNGGGGVKLGVTPSMRSRAARGKDVARAPEDDSLGSAALGILGREAGGHSVHVGTDQRTRMVGSLKPDSQDRPLVGRAVGSDRLAPTSSRAARDRS